MQNTCEVNDFIVSKPYNHIIKLYTFFWKRFNLGIHQKRPIKIKWTRCVRRRLTNASPLFNSLSNRLRITTEFQSWSVAYDYTFSYKKSS